MSEAKVKFTADTSSFNRGTKEVNSGLGSINKTISVVAGAFAGMFVFKKVGDILGGFKGLVVESSKVAAGFETIGIQLEVLTGSADKARRLMADLLELGKNTPLETKDLQESTKTLLQFGVALDDIIPLMQDLGDVSMGNGETLKSMTRVFGQVASAGRLTLEDVNQLINAGFNPLDSISKRLGTTMAETRKRITAGAVSSGALRDALTEATTSGGRFENMMGRIAKTTEGKLSNYKDAITDVKRILGEQVNIGFGESLTKLTANIPRLNGIAEKVGKVISDLIEWSTTHGLRIVDVLIKSVQDDGIWKTVTTNLAKAIRSDEVKQAVNEIIQSIPLVEEIKKSIVGQGVGVLGNASPESKELLGWGFLLKLLSSRGSAINRFGSGLTGAGLIGAGRVDIVKNGDIVKGSESAVGNIMAVTGLAMLVPAVTDATTLMRSLGDRLKVFVSKNPFALLYAASLAAGLFLGNAIAKAEEKRDNDKAGNKTFDHNGKKISLTHGVALDTFNFEGIDLFKNIANKPKEPLTQQGDFIFPEMAERNSASKLMAMVKADIQAKKNLENRSFIDKDPSFQSNIDAILKIPKKGSKTPERFNFIPPALTSLARIGGAASLTKDPLVSIQQQANNFLEQIVKNTSKNSKAAFA